MKFLVIIILSVLHSIRILAQDMRNQESESDITNFCCISVDFYSTGQGINMHAVDELFKYLDIIEKDCQTTIPIEKIYWGKEGEETIYLEATKLSFSKRQIFINQIKELCNDSSKMATAQALNYNTMEQRLTLEILTPEQMNKREVNILKYIEKQENKDRISVLSVTDDKNNFEVHSKRYEFGLSGISKYQRIQVINSMRKLIR